MRIRTKNIGWINTSETLALAHYEEENKEQCTIKVEPLW